MGLDKGTLPQPQEAEPTFTTEFGASGKQCSSSYNSSSGKKHVTWDPDLPSLPDSVPAPLPTILEYEGAQLAGLSKRVEVKKPRGPNPEGVPIHSKVVMGEGRQVNMGTTLTLEENRVI